jgi:hypothetical protein
MLTSSFSLELYSQIPLINVLCYDLETSIRSEVFTEEKITVWCSELWHHADLEQWYQNLEKHATSSYSKHEGSMFAQNMYTYVPDM